MSEHVVLVAAEAHNLVLALHDQVVAHVGAVVAGSRCQLVRSVAEGVGRAGLAGLLGLGWFD